jgi:hypothetical protein
MTLFQLQRRMAHAVMQPLTSADRIAPKTDAGFIKPNDRLTSVERLEIYSRSYWFRVLDSLYDDFPGLRAVLGQRAFHRLGMPFAVILRPVPCSMRPGAYHHSQGGRGSSGMSFGDHGARCKISVGRQTTMGDLYNDWELTHEMVHFSFPSVADSHHWIEEGIATYVEPIARASVGILTAERVWGEMLRDMPQGLPQAGDRGLDNTHTWGRTYWGGALFCLMAGVEIRKRTGNAKGLQDALRAINRAGGTIEADWPLERAFEIGDKATDGGTLMELYAHMASKPVEVDLPRLWAQLGVRANSRGVALDDQAPWAAIRSGICRAIRRWVRYMTNQMKIQLRLTLLGK